MLWPVSDETAYEYFPSLCNSVLIAFLGLEIRSLLDEARTFDSYQQGIFHLVWTEIEFFCKWIYTICQAQILFIYQIHSLLSSSCFYLNIDFLFFRKLVISLWAVRTNHEITDIHFQSWFRNNFSLRKNTRKLFYVFMKC